MSVKVKYNDELITEIKSGQTLTLKCKDEAMEHNLVIEDYGSPVPEVPEWDGKFTKSVDLTGTTWEIPSGWQTAANQASFGIEGEFIVDNTTINIVALYLGTYALSASSTYEANTITVVKAEDNSVHAMRNTSGFTLKIKGGVDATNPYLAKWLQSDGKDTDWTIIRFHIEDENGDFTGYKALGGMTWGEWVESDFNTDGYKVSGTNIFSASGEIVITESYVAVNSGEEIVANATYVLSASGGV